MKLVDVVETKYPTLRKDEKIKHVLNIMYKTGVDRVIVTKNKEDLYGIATEWDIFFKLSILKRVKYRPYDLPLSSVTTYPVDVLTTTASIKTAIDMFLINGYSSIPILENGKIIGLVTKAGIIRNYKDRFKEMELKVEDVMGNVKGKIDLMSSLKNAENKFRLGGFNTLIVHSKGRYVGIITTLDLAKLLFQIRKLHPTHEWGRYIERINVADIIRRDVTVLKPTDHIYDAADILSTGRQKIIPIVDNGQVEGVISRRHILKIILENLL